MTAGTRKPDAVVPVEGFRRALDLGRESVSFAWADMRATYTWRTYVFAWMARLLLQVVFFAMVAGYTGDEASMQYALVGNAIALGSLEAMVVVALMVQERWSGTLPLLAIAPTSHVPVYLGRGLHFLVSGMISSTIAFVVLPAVTGVPLPWPRAALALPLIVVVCLSSYCYGCFLASVALRHFSVTWLILNLGYLPIMAFCGVNVPTSFWPAPLETLALMLPLTHGLAAIRGVLDGSPAAWILGQAGLEVLIGLAWLTVAIFSIRLVVRRGVADGTLEFGS